jgi:hypothetical protein
MPVIETFGSTARGPFWMLVGTTGRRYHRWPAGSPGTMPGTALLSTQGPMVKKQILYALAAQLRTETQPDR